MNRERKILAIITARGGSKSLPDKNIKKLNKLFCLSKENPSTKNISTTEIDTRVDFRPDSLAKSLNFS